MDEKLISEIVGLVTGAGIFAGVAWAIIKVGLKKYFEKEEKLEALEEQAIVQKIETSVNNVRFDLKNLAKDIENKLEKMREQGDAQVRKFEEVYAGIKHIINKADVKFASIETELHKLSVVTAKLVVHTNLQSMGKVLKKP